MHHRPTSALVSWLLVPVAALLIRSALSLPGYPYTGMALRSGRVESVDRASPAERAGLRAGDRLLDPAAASDRLPPAAPGRPVELLRDRGGSRTPVWIVPETLPASERRFRAGLLAVASIFVLLGGWVWSERRDALTRTFLLLCFSFASLLGFAVASSSWGARDFYPILESGLLLFVPALLVHFFALFPESRAEGSRSAWISLAYGAASLLFAFELLFDGLRLGGTTVPPRVLQVFEGVGLVWFTAGVVLALTLFLGSYRRAESADSRRRLRVALVGSVLGLAPFTLFNLLRNLVPGLPLPGDRAALSLVVLVPISFAWATVVHRVFEFRIAVRGVVVALVIAAVGAAAFTTGEWWATTWWPDRAAAFAGGVLAFVALASSLSGPAAPLLRTLGARLVPDPDGQGLMAWLHDVAGSGGPRGSAGPRAEDLLAGACDAISRALRLSGCLALVPGSGGVRAIVGRNGLPEPGPELRLRVLDVARRGLQGVDEAGFDADESEALDGAGVSWLLPVGGVSARSVLLLGRRLAGAWLGRREVIDLERFATHLAVALENAELRREATSHGALAREMQAAASVQAHFRPQRVPVHPTLDCAAAVVSSEAVGGDYYDFVETTDRAFTLVVGDAAGKGMPAALLLAHVQARFRGEAARGRAPGELLSVLNDDLVEFDQPEKFVGLLCARVDVRRGQVAIANGGLTPPLVSRRDGRVDRIESGGMLLGVRRGAEYPEVHVDLDEGDVVLVYTDGLTEAVRGAEMFGVDRAAAVLAREAHRRAPDILRAFLSEVRGFSDGPLDDLTLVVLKQLTPAPKA